MLCACRKASGNEEECTRPTEAHPCLHEGNDEADRLAKLSKDLEPITDLTELLKGEEAYVLGTGNEIAQGAYRAWIQTKLNNTYVETSQSIRLSKLKAAKGEAQQTLWASAIKGLGTGRHVSWKLWSRIITETLPTNHKLSRMANSNEDNIYHWVYGGELGAECTCRREECGKDSENLYLDRE